MQRVTRKAVVLALAGLAACTGDPTSDLRGGIDHLLATPGTLFVTEGTTATVLIEAVDEQGNRTGTNFSLGTVGAGVDVVEDDSFNLIFNDKGKLVRPDHPTRTRYEITPSTSTASTSFEVSAGGKSVTIPVRVVPLAAAAVTLSATTPALGDTVVATAGANFRFTPASQVSVPGASVATLTISPDSSTLRFIPGPGANGAVSITNLVVQYAPAIGTFTATSGGANLTTPAIAAIPAVFSATNVNVNETFTISAPGFKFLPDVRVLFGNDAQAVTAISVDSNTITVRAHQAGASGTITIANAALSFLPSAPFTAPAPGVVTVGATVTEIAGTGSPATAPVIAIPAAGQTSGVVDAPTSFPNDQSGLCGGPCNARIYKFTVAAQQEVTVTATWNSTTDIGVYLGNATGGLQSTATFPPADNLGSGAGGHPETTTWDLPPGDYTILVIDFLTSGSPTSLTIDFAGL